MYKRSACLVATLCSFAGLAHAGQAEICYSDPYSLTSPSVPPTNATVFHCPGAGNLTLPQLAAAGWLAVQLIPISLGGTQGADQLLIQKP